MVMGDVINLRQVRKAKKRAAQEVRADANRAKHGLSKADKLIAEITKQKYDAALEGARRDQAED